MLDHFFSRVLANGDTPTGEFINEFGSGQSSNFSRFILGELALGVPVAGGRQDEFLGKIAWRFAKSAIDIIGRFKVIVVISVSLQIESSNRSVWSV